MEPAWNQDRNKEGQKEVTEQEGQIRGQSYKGFGLETWQREQAGVPLTWRLESLGWVGGSTGWGVPAKPLPALAVPAHS